MPDSFRKTSPDLTGLSDFLTVSASHLQTRLHLITSPRARMYGQLGCSANHRSNGQPPACVDWMARVSGIVIAYLVHLLHQPNHSTPPYVSLVFSPLSPGLLVRLSVCLFSCYIFTRTKAHHPYTDPALAPTHRRLLTYDGRTRDRSSY